MKNFVEKRARQHNNVVYHCVHLSCKMAASVPFSDVPTIDISPLYGDVMEAKQEVAKLIAAACRGSGFFYVSHHNVDVQALQDKTNKFHKTMTDYEKYDLAIHAYNPLNSRVRNGYYMAIKDKKAVESFCYLNPSFTPDHPRIQDNTPCHEVNVWPDEAKHPGFRAFNEGYFRDMFKLSAAVLRGFALALGQQEDFFDSHFTKEGTLSSVALIRYPYLNPYPTQAIKTAPDGTLLSFGDHKDVSLITVLYQTPVMNLQVEEGGQKEGEGEYKNIAPAAGKYLVNCGTYMAYITNNYFHAPTHRVTFINNERLSLPFFVNLDHYSAIPPFFPFNNINNGSNNVPLPYGQYLQKELRVLIVKNGQT